MKIVQEHSNELTNLYETKLNVETHTEDMSKFTEGMSKINEKLVSLIFDYIYNSQFLMSSSIHS